MKRAVFVIAMLLLSVMTNYAYGDSESVVCGFNVVARSQAMGGEFMFYTSLAGVRFNLNIGFCGNFTPIGDNKAFCYAEPGIGYNFYIQNHEGFSNIFVMVGVKSFASTLNKDIYVNPDVLITLTAHLGYTKFFNNNIGINTEIVVETYSMYGNDFIRTYKKFTDGIVGSCGVVYKF